MKCLLSTAVALMLVLAPAAPAAAQSSAVEVTFWESVRDSKDTAEIEAYLKAYPDGKFVPLAHIRLNRLKPGTAADIQKPPADEAIAMKYRKESIAVRIGALPDSKRGWLGVHIDTVSDELARAFGLENATGVLVVKVSPGSPADMAGIRPGDVIIEFNGQDVAGSRELAQMVAATPSSSEVKAVVWRAIRGFNGRLGWLRNRASNGDSDAMYGLAWIYQRGIGVAKDEAQAARWYRKAADKGHPTAMSNLGWMYKNGRGVAKNEVEAVIWYRKAADNGEAHAMLNIGLAYAYGRSVEKDEAQAVRWYRKAADKGYAIAMFNLGVVYADGQGVAG